MVYCNAEKLFSSIKLIPFFCNPTDRQIEKWKSLMNFEAISIFSIPFSSFDRKTDSFDSLTKEQSYERNLVLKKTKLVLNSLTVHCFR